MYGGGLVALLGGGWLAYDQFLATGGPVGTTKSFINALDAGNAEKANKLIHRNAPISGIPDYTIQQFESIDISIDEAQLESETETSATVKVTLTAAESATGQSQSTTQTVELRTEDGEWKIYRTNLL